MRSLKITLVLFSALVLCIVFNSLYIRRCADRISEMAEGIRMGEDVGELEDFWSKNEKLFGISISETQLDYISRLIISIGHDHRNGNTSELEKNIALLTDAVQGIRRYESFSLENIF